MSILKTQELQSLRQSDYTHFTIEIYCSGIRSQAGGCIADRTAPGGFHPPCTLPNSHINVQWDYRTKLFLNTVWQESSLVYDLYACGWILDPRCTRLNWSTIWKFLLQILQISLLKVCLFQLFQGLRFATILRVARGANLATVNSKGRSVVRLAEWLLILGAQDG
jgi:hypothetical protein